MLKKTLIFLKKEVYWAVLTRALLSLLPIVAGFIITGNVMFWNIGLVTISLGVGAERLKLGMKGVSLHFLLIIVCFTILFFAFLIPYLFVLICALMAFSTIYFTRHGSKIRTLANYTFIPTVYLTCELHEKIVFALTFSTYQKFIILSPIALITALLVYGMPYWIKYRKMSLNKVRRSVDFGDPEELWVEPAIAIFLGVTLAASLVIFLHISRGEWVIWSVASVITVEFADTKKKFNDRMLGALMGVPLGLLMAQFVPKTESMYILAILGIMLTLVAFKRYRLAFGFRCFFVALAAFIASSTTTIAIERIANVWMGGVIGLTAVYIIGLFFNRFRLLK